ncbi:MAG: type IV secretion system DNA-binding domain-containing protein [Anaerolineae bacterium]|nr:type IV secretion system DNA-binding domain-containing protein [Anaerolineae bacterium]NUQ06495.1 ATP-binding protein [Anaerolineae bacterium]
MSTALADIRAKLDGEDRDEALSLLSQYILDHPGDLEARLLKAEVCLQDRVDYGFVGGAAESLASDDPEQSARIAALRQEVETRAWELVNSGRGKMRTRMGGDPLPDFDSALLLRPNEPVVALAAALALIRHNGGASPYDSLFEEDDVFESPPAPTPPAASLLGSFSFGRSGARPAPPTGQWNAAIERYLRRVIALTAPRDRLYEVAAVCLVKHNLSSTLNPDTLALMDTLGTPHKSWQAVHQELISRSLALLHDTAAGFLRANADVSARRILAACEDAGVLIPRLMLLDAERHPLGSAARRSALRKARRLGDNIFPDSPLRVLKDLLILAQGIQFKCGICGREIRPTAETCPFCESKPAVRLLLIDRYDLKQPAYTTAALRIGLAETLEAEGKRDAAREELVQALELLPEEALGKTPLGVLRGKLERGQSKLPSAQPAEDSSVHMALHQTAGGAITQDVVTLITRINDHEPEAWARLTTTQRASLVRRLTAAGHLKLARDVLALAFAEDSAGKRGIEARQALDRAISARLETVIGDAEALIQAGKPEAAIALLSDALALRDDARLHLARGDARLALGHDLQALGDFYAVSRDADAAVSTRARKAAVGILERRWDIEGARALLSGINDDVFVSRALARLARRADGAPAVIVEAVREAVTDDTLTRRAAETHYHGYFAVMVREVGIGGDEAFYRRLGSAHFEFVQLLGAQRELTSRAVFALRIICEPHRLIPARGRLTVAVLARVSAVDEATCRALALSLWGDINAMLPLAQENVYIYEPVVDEDELFSLLSPFEPLHIAEIARRETHGSAAGVYTVNPFISGSPDLHNVFWMMMRQPAPSLISVQLMPTTLYAWERPVQEDRPDLGGAYGGEGGMDPVTPSGYSINYLKRQLAQQQQWQKLNIADQRLTVLQNGYVMRVYVAGSEGTSQLLPEMAASTLFAPLQDGGVNGGCQILRPGKPEETQTLRRNLAMLDVESWGGIPDDPRLARFRNLVGEGEAAAIFRLPVPHSGGVPGMNTLEGKALVPPAGMPVNGTRLGVSVARVRGVPVPITQGLDDRRRHSYVVGKTGMGKSTLLQTLILQDIDAGRGVFLLDPHGDLCDDVLARIPSHRQDDVILLDPSDEEYPIGLNILQIEDEADRDRVVSDFIGLLIRLYDPHNYAVVGPIFQQTVRNAMLAAMSLPNGTLVDVYRLVSDQDGSFVSKVLPHIKDPIVRNYYEDVAKRMRDASSQWKAEFLPYILSKFSRFVEDATLRRMIGQTRSGIPYPQIMDEGKVFLVNLAKGRVGEQNALFIGSLILSGVMQAAFKRGALPPHRRRDFFIYVDEVQNFATPTLATMLSEGRKFGVVLTIANQYLHQLSPPILEAVFGNIGSIVAFRLGIQDSAALGMEFYPSFAQQELSGLPQFTAAVKLLIDGVATRPFTMRTLPSMVPPDKARSDLIRENSRRRYGTPLAQVEQEIVKRFK